MENLRTYWRDLVVDRGRMIMVALGLMWGVLSLTVVLAFGSGFQKAMMRATTNSGVDLLRIWNGATTRPWQGRSAGHPIRLTAEDARYLEKAIPELRGTCVEYISSGVPITYEDQTSNIGLHGVEPIYQEIRRFPVQAGGRFLNRKDENERRRVAFLGDAIKQRLVGSDEAVGKEIDLFGYPFTVVGVLRTKATLSNYEGLDKNKVLIPASTFKALRGYRWVNYLLLWLPDLESSDWMVTQVYQALGERHGFHPDDQKAIGIMDHVLIHDRVSSIVESTRYLLIVITVFGFLVSLVGVANVMYVMVEERQREFGIQMALGARPALILQGRLIEGILITLVGGGAGILLSAVVVRVMNWLPIDPEARHYLGYPEMSLLAAGSLTLLLGVAGCLAGYWPARRAAAIQPVVTLHE